MDAPPEPDPAPPSQESAPVAESLETVDVFQVQPGLDGFLEQIALVSEQEARELEKTEGKVSLMTVHTAKGLEFDHVYLLGLEDGLFPNARALEERDGLEEERRLAYVAITRARKKLSISRANARSRFGRSSDFRPPSGFLFELPDDVFLAGKSPRNLAPYARGASSQKAWDDADEGYEDANATLAEVDDEDRLWQRSVSDERRGKKPERPEKNNRGQTASEAARELLAQVGERARAATAETAIDFKVGERVRHEHFGVGKVLEVSGHGHSKRVKVLFIEFGEKNLVLQYARLQKVPS
jgi:DNA helicase-2/ATP-dependent DNA helicase PcrA